MGSWGVVCCKKIAEAEAAVSVNGVVGLQRRSSLSVGQ
jgi:hypothetical protein